MCSAHVLVVGDVWWSNVHGMCCELYKIDGASQLQLHNAWMSTTQHEHNPCVVLVVEEWEHVAVPELLRELDLRNHDAPMSN